MNKWFDKILIKLSVRLNTPGTCWESNSFIFFGPGTKNTSVMQTLRKQKKNNHAGKNGG